MSITLGQAASDPVTGIAGDLFNLRVYGNLAGTGAPRSYYLRTNDGALHPAARALLAADCEAEALWLQTVLTTRITATALVTTSSAGLQRYADAGGAMHDTGAPTAEHTLAVTVT